MSSMPKIMSSVTFTFAFTFTFWFCIERLGTLMEAKTPELVLRMGFDRVCAPFSLKTRLVN